MSGSEQERQFAALLAEIGRTHMPFGKFGPKEYPPRGVPLHDLPYEYLAWFQRKGFPKGRLGELMEVVFLAKRDGLEELFEPLRKAAGGRVSLRRARRRHWDFEGEAGSDGEGEGPKPGDGTDRGTPRTRGKNGL